MAGIRAEKSGLWGNLQKRVRAANLRPGRLWPNLFWGLVLCTLVLTSESPVFAEKGFQFEDVVRQAGALAAKPFEEPEKVPDVLSKLTYDQWRDIRFKPEEALWRGDKLPFEVQFFHPGSLYTHAVEIEIVASGKVKPLNFSPDQFHYGLNAVQDKVPQNLGFAGFRLHSPIKTQQYYDEVAVFLGASYFRAVGKDQIYGLSARGAAIDMAQESGEEFPYFRKFWLVRPEKKEETMTVFAVLDSPSLTGAYRFVIKPGKVTRMEVSATLYFRKEVKKLGIAPLTSMFFYGENSNIRPVDDFRPEIHDSDGLQIITDTDEWTWRPLINPKRLLVTSFELNNPKGFGLLQRDADFDHYQDLEASYQLRPSAWVVPGKGWGRGRVELVQIPTDSEKNDNIVTCWVPDSLPQPGAPFSFSYQLRWGAAEDIAAASPSRILATRTAVDDQKGKLYLIDFKGGKLGSLPANAKVEADISVGGGEVVEQHLRKAGDSGVWRLVFRVKGKESSLDKVITSNHRPLEMRAILRRDNEVLTETWSYVDPL